MRMGTGKITKVERGFWLHYKNMGSDLRCEPRFFFTEAELHQFCASRLLRVTK